MRDSGSEMLGAKDCCTGALRSSSGLELLLGQASCEGEVERRARGVRITAVTSTGQGGGQSRDRSAAVRSGKGARERRLQKVADERKRKQNEEAGKYPEWAT